MSLPITKFGFATFVYIFNQDFTKILLIRRNKEKTEKYGAEWGSIGGKIERGEISIQACIREAKEEAGLNLNSSELKLFSVKEIINHLIGEYAIHFRYFLVLNEDIALTLNSESDGFSWFDFRHLPDKMFESKEEISSILDAVKNQNKELSR